MPPRIPLYSGPALTHGDHGRPPRAQAREGPMIPCVFQYGLNKKASGSSIGRGKRVNLDRWNRQTRGRSVLSLVALIVASSLVRRAHYPGSRLHWPNSRQMRDGAAPSIARSDRPQPSSLFHESGLHAESQPHALPAAPCKSIINLSSIFSSDSWFNPSIRVLISCKFLHLITFVVVTMPEQLSGVREKKDRCLLNCKAFLWSDEA
jgi:hypothetical protein